jgi:c(7)-type cytochrome triheme protein
MYRIITQKRIIHWTYPFSLAQTILRRSLMLCKTLLVTLVTTVFLTGTVLAVPPGKVIEFSDNPMGKVLFDGTVHKKADITCQECHKDGLFPKMKQGTVKITMEDIYAGRLCGVCHNGKRAFAAPGNCNRCHIK